MGTTADHRRYAEECVAMAQRAGDGQVKARWLSLAQSWVRLAEYIECSSADALETAGEETSPEEDMARPASAASL